MISKKQIILEKEGLMGLRNLMEVYQEVAAGRMQRVRGAVLQSRFFMEGLVSVFKRVRAAYKNSPMAGKSVRKMNGRMVAVFVSANSGLFGDIVDRTFESFNNFVSSQHPDVVILGKQGIRLMADKLPQVLYNFYDFSDEGIDMESFDMIMRYLIQFEKIYVFHGRFKTILQQEAVQTTVSGEGVEAQNTEVVPQQYLFEPSVEQIARIFEGEILASIFEQSLHESQLAKFASRMLALDKSIENIDTGLDKVKITERRVMHAIRNRKQLNTIAGISLWS